MQQKLVINIFVLFNHVGIALYLVSIIYVLKLKGCAAVYDSSVVFVTNFFYY